MSVVAVPVDCMCECGSGASIQLQRQYASAEEREGNACYQFGFRVLSRMLLASQNSPSIVSGI